MSGALTVRERRERDAKREGREYFSKWACWILLAGALPVMFCFITGGLRVPGV